MAGAVAQMTLDDSCNRTLLAPGNVVRLRANNKKFIRITKTDTVDANAMRGTRSHFRVSPGDGGTIRFESVADPGKFLRVGDDHSVGVGKGGKKCLFTIKDVSPGVVILSTSNGSLGIKEDGSFRPADKVQGHAPAQFAVDAILDPALLGLGGGDLVRLKSMGSGKYVRVKDVVDIEGGNGAVPYMEAAVANGNVTFQNKDNGKFLGVDDSGMAVASPNPTFFTPMFSAADRTVVLIINGHPTLTGTPFGMGADGKPKAKGSMGQDMEKTDRFILEAPLAPVLYGLVPNKHYRLHNIKKDKCIRMVDEGATVTGGMGPATDLIFHLGKDNPVFTVWESNKTKGKHLRTSPDGVGIDSKGGKQGPRAQIRLVNLGANKVALLTKDGFIIPDKAPKDSPKVTPEAEFDILPVQ